MNKPNTYRDEPCHVFWIIVPINDGCTYLCFDKKRGHYLKNKAEDLPNDVSFLFPSKRGAEMRIDLFSEEERGKYRVEWFMIGKERMRKWWEEIKNGT